MRDKYLDLSQAGIYLLLGLMCSSLIGLLLTLFKLKVWQYRPCKEFNVTYVRVKPVEQKK